MRIAPSSLLRRLLAVVGPASVMLVACDDGPGASTDQTQPGSGGNGSAGASGAAGAAGAAVIVSCVEEPATTKLCVAGQYDQPCVQRRCYVPGGANPPGCLAGPTAPDRPLDPAIQKALGGLSTCYDDDTSRGSTGPYCPTEGDQTSCCYLIPLYLCEGRPLLVDGAARTASLAFGAAW